jgi:adenylate cyclase
MEIALRLSPHTRIGQSLAAIGRAHLLTRCFEAAIPKLLLAIHEDPSFPNPHFSLAACYAHMGRLEDARETLARLRAITSNVTLHVMRDISHYRNRQHREFLLKGVQLAAGETI